MCGLEVGLRPRVWIIGGEITPSLRGARQALRAKNLSGPLAEGNLTRLFSLKKHSPLADDHFFKEKRNPKEQKNYNKAILADYVNLVNTPLEVRNFCLGRNRRFLTSNGFKYPFKKITPDQRRGG